MVQAVDDTAVAPPIQAQTRAKPAIDTRGLTKRYGNRLVAVHELSLKVQQGEIYGFLGPNGAGKTTTLRMLTGLIRPTSGTASVLGERPGSPASLARLGAMIEAPAFYPYLSGRDNLLVLARYAGVAESRIIPALESVQLAGRASDPFSTYSLGMKQRLGVAAALLKDPDLLILDEPTNGLDPAGMADMRELIRRLGREGRTVLLSSHLMNEVEQICDRVGVISKGRLVAEGTIDELRGHDRLRLRAQPLEKARQLIEGMEGIGGIEAAGNALQITADAGAIPAINRALVQGGVDVFELAQDRSSLEEVFLELTSVVGQEGGTANAG